MRVRKFWGARYAEYRTGIRLEAMSTNPSPKLLAPEDLEHAVDRLALAMPLATSDQPFGPEHTAYRVGGKIFAMYTEGIGYPIVNL